MFVLDANVASELRKVRLGKADARVAKWADDVDAATLCLSAMSVMELEIGVIWIERRDARQRAMLRTWLQSHVLPAFVGRILPVDTAAARRCAARHARESRSDRDALIAATALVHGTTIVTRNIADFEPAGAMLLNPWNYPPSA